jgi:3-carboxy-cis,cis-muconate cycloisomerase
VIDALLEVEAALAAAQAQLGHIPVEHAQAIAQACSAGVELDEEAARTSTPVVALVAALREAVGEEAAASVHLGATSQDIMDTAAMLTVRERRGPILEDLVGAANTAADLARAHRSTPMAGRTLLQRATPITFGSKAALWTAALDDAGRGVARLALPVQLGGPVGTLADTDLLAAFADRLDLDAPPLSWHTARAPVARIAAALGIAAGVAGKVATDVILMAQTEVGEACEEGGEGYGGSSTMPHKHNPIAAISARAAARRAPALVATVMASMEQEHERAAGAWQAEGPALRDLLSVTGEACDRLRESLERLVVDPERMAANLGEEEPDVSDAEALVDRALDGRR